MYTGHELLVHVNLSFIIVLRKAFELSMINGYASDGMMNTSYMHAVTVFEGGICSSIVPRPSLPRFFLTVTEKISCKIESGQERPESEDNFVQYSGD